MARYRLSDPAKADIVAILRRSADLHGHQARIRYRALLTSAMRRAAADPEGPLTADQSGLLPGTRSVHMRYARKESREARVANPVHVIFFRALRPGLIEVIRILHERMDPRHHVGAKAGSPDSSEE